MNQIAASSRLNNPALANSSADIRVVIADDEQLARQLLLRLAESQPGLSVVGQAEDGSSAARLIERKKPDLVFLDIMMPKVNGIDLMKSLQDRRDRPHVVFVTAFDDYAIRAFDLDVLDYLVKPVARDRFAQSVERARAAVCAKRVQRLGEEIAAVSAGNVVDSQSDAEAPYIIVRQRDELIRIAEEDIYWLEAASQYVRIHTEATHYIVAEPLNKYHARLSSDLFVRVHRSAVVNVSKVKHVIKRHNGVHELKLSNGVGVPLSRSRRSLVNDFLGVCAASTKLELS